MSNKQIDFEKQLARLEEIVKDMEEKTLPLQESLRLFEEGQTLIKELHSSLKAAEIKIEELTKSSEVNK